ncbi:sensor histidine kinase [Rhizobium oryzicola]|uniref:histidine kinase n=1 Tax=Rhizobium oryzicola TaxID=1232668 RepID=A0ABT8T3X2_9HYPH|nr:HAMP domain-containing sensor histidine kinase [Rhizobium oryzicola]MDO1584886.1 HAMP domain-containing sensor histidine kinase [Rhizobium oryzicola]
MSNTLNTHIVRAMVGLTLVAFAVMYFGFMAYYFFIYEWLYPDAVFDEKWQTSDFVLLAVILSTGVITASFVGWRMAQQIVRPLKSVAGAARLISEGDFSARAETVGTAFGEAKSLIHDFNSMAERLQKAEAEIKYSNSSIAHELRTPLTILRGRLQGLLDGAFQPTPELYNRLIVHVDDLSTIVEELRTLALTNVGQLALDLSEVDLPLEVASVLASVEEDLRQAGIKIHTDLEDAQTHADRTRIRQAILAMVDNCRRYAPGSIVSLKTGKTADYLFVRCSDTGPGLPAENREKAFERFWRADDSRTRSRGGSGLGLSIVRGIARAHGGEALIVDHDGPGFSVELRLPQHHAVDRDKGRPDV